MKKASKKIAIALLVCILLTLCLSSISFASKSCPDCGRSLLVVSSDGQVVGSYYVVTIKYLCPYSGQYYYELLYY